MTFMVDDNTKGSNGFYIESCGPIPENSERSVFFNDVKSLSNFWPKNGKVF